MDFLTAGVAIIAVQLCMALAMAGIYLADRERALGSQYWAIAETLSAIGILGIVLDAGASRPWVLMISNNALVWAGILQLWGLRAFFGQDRHVAGWIAGVVFFAAHTTLLVDPGSMKLRLLLFALTMMTLFSFSARSAWAGTRSGRSLGAWLVIGSLVMLIVNNMLRIGAVLTGVGKLTAAVSSGPAVIVLYLVPLAGVVLYSVGLLLLYFERAILEQQHLATHDSLTGLMNRRALVTAGEREIELARRSGLPLSVALVDIDHFKTVNDELGHQAGDNVLIEMSRLFAGVCRKGDLIGRYGGEEFVIVFPGVDGSECEALGQRLLESARGYRYQGKLPVTVSVGFASTFAGDTRETWNTLLTRADVALYQSKSSGRNRMSFQDTPSLRTRDTRRQPVPSLPAARA